ncbi:VWA domain containing CoxE-like protein [Polystyrenella longa]|uniref:VWA domain containing CoxE-like protein n=1 Tax=Polystyrenella longa TaxID=2528007 RepID=A0A518CGX7_9PLAN|nr:DUF58 domain-containing protein [Polystyrenella longa]QDU78477.1 VWA domain containing CoxE-like protein [Polystyrenella longa]
MKLSVLKKASWIKRSNDAEPQPKSKKHTLLDPDVLRQIGHLELLTQRVVDGFLTGKHRSTHKGGCFEFAQHRPYTAGDEIRLIDWHVFAKSDRYYIKQFEEETNLQAMMVVDASGSMKYSGSTISKFDYARLAAACLSRLVLRQRDSVGLTLIDQSIRKFIPPRSSATHLQSLLSTLLNEETSGMTSLSTSLHELGRRMKRKGMILLFSDCFEELEPLTQALHHLRLRGHEILIFQTIAPEELTFKFDKMSKFECLEEDNLILDVDPHAVRKGYLKRLNEFQTQLQRRAVEMGCEYFQLNTGSELGTVLAQYLSRRNAGIKV